mmetsp:Transcript_77544/g.136810  ORF Transcript_77544/g.136810 Transcript_77544/m.136810 type:complete len:345 (+) Transcript_77544:40-1074(+)
MMRSLVVLLCHSAAAHVVRLHPEQLHFSVDHAELADAIPPLLVAEHEKLSHLRGGAQTGSDSDLTLFTKQTKGACINMLLALCFLCCGGGCLKATVGERAASFTMTFLSAGLFFYLLFSGIYSAYWNGEEVGLACKIMCWWAILQMVCFSIATVMFCFVFGAGLVIKNTIIQKMREEYEVRMKEISGPRRDYYESQLFRDKCESLFQEADADGNGTLDMKELQAILVKMTGDKGIASVAPLLQEAFEQHGDSSVEQHEFVEMMKFVSVISLKEGSITLQQAFEILQLPETASKSEITKSYHKMALKYHPDKRSDVDPEVARRDMGQINDAHAKAQESFKQKAEP